MATRQTTWERNVLEIDLAHETAPGDPIPTGRGRDLFWWFTHGENRKTEGSTTGFAVQDTGSTVRGRLGRRFCNDNGPAVSAPLRGFMFLARAGLWFGAGHKFLARTRFICYWL